MDLQHHLYPDLLTTAAADVGWDIDLDEVPITCAQLPHLVVALIDASAAHLAALAGSRVLDHAADGLRTVMDGAPAADLDWHARLLGAVLDHADARRAHTDRTRRRLLTALKALQPEGVTWPPQPSGAAIPDGGDQPADLPAALAHLGLHLVPAASDASHTTYAHTTDRQPGHRTLTVTVHPNDDNTAEVHVFDGHAVAWSMTFSPGTPPTLIANAVRDALPETP